MPIHHEECKTLPNQPIDWGLELRTFLGNPNLVERDSYRIHFLFTARNLNHNDLTSIPDKITLDTLQYRVVSAMLVSADTAEVILTKI